MTRWRHALLRLWLLHSVAAVIGCIYVLWLLWKFWGAGLMKALGTPDVTPELKKTIAEGVSQMAAGHSVEQLAQEENKLLVELIKLRAQRARVLAAEAHA